MRIVLISCIFPLCVVCLSEVDMWSLIVSALLALAMPIYGHVGLYYPPARTYALDFLDSARTQPPCGMARGALLRLSLVHQLSLYGAGFVLMQLRDGWSAGCIDIGRSIYAQA